VPCLRFIRGKAPSLNANFEHVSDKGDNRTFNCLKEQIMKRILIAICTLTLVGLPLASLAGPDEAQRMMIQRIQEQKLKLNAAKAAQGAERPKLMAEHMKMMQATMGKMQTMKPRADMSPKEKDEWISEHHKLMEQMMGQMMEEHHMLMQGMGK
jgi:ABC-type transporter MlaC component